MDFNHQSIEEFRSRHGRVGGPFEDARLLLLTTTGARTGAARTVPLGYLLDDGGRLLVIGSAAGAPRHPAWYHNVRANPRVTVETGVFTFRADAVVLDGAERDRLFARAVETDPGWAEYQTKTERVLPVVALVPVEGAPDDVGGWGEALKLVHDAFRRELALVRKEVAESGASVGAQLRINCLALCRGLRHHHGIEDEETYPFLGERHPELAPVLTELRQQHVRLDRLLDQLQATLADTSLEPAVLGAEVDRLAAQVEAHLDEEEEQLVEVLDAASVVAR